MLPVRFAIPFDCRPSDPLASDDSIVWRLEATAEVPGVDFRARFDVPVFETPASDRERSAALIARERGPVAPRPADTTTWEVRVRPGPRGSTELFFPAGRQKGAAFLTTLFGLAFAGVVVVLHTQAAPLPVTAIFAGFTALILYGALTLWAGSTRVLARGDGVAIQDRLFGIGRWRHVPAEQIDGVALEVGMQSGSTVYWDLRLRTRGGRPTRRGRPSGVRVGGRLRDKREAERLAELLRTALPLADTRAEPGI
jgi:hypothetical protein